MEDKIKAAFDTLHMDAGCTNKIETAMNLPTQKYLFSRPIFHLAFAVCLCVILPITALGIEKMLPRVKLGTQSVTNQLSSYNAVADLVPWSVDQFSSTLQNDLHAGTLQQTFHDKDSLNNYLGFDLSQNRELENAELVADLDAAFAYGFTLRPQLALDTSARYILTACDLEGNQAGLSPDVLKISAHRVFMNTEVYLDAWIILDSTAQEALENGILGENFLPVSGFNMEMVYDENGNFVRDSKGVPVVTLLPFTSCDYEFDESSYTMANGNVATVITSRFKEPDGSYGISEYMGYFVQDGILYSVRPYAIYNPEESFPNLDSDNLVVLREVLDTFE